MPLSATVRDVQVLSLSRYEFAAESAGTLKWILPSRVVYDVGAGLGVMRERIIGSGLEWRGFDAYPVNETIQQWNLEDRCPISSPKAGLVLMLDVIEHLRNPGMSLHNVAAVVMAGGRLLVTTPNPRWSRSRIAALRTGFLCCFTEDDLTSNGHIFPVWPHVLARLLGDAGFEIERYVTLDGPTTWPSGPLSRRHPLRIAHSAINKWIERRDPTACGMSYAIVGRKQA